MSYLTPSVPLILLFHSISNSLLVLITLGHRMIVIATNVAETSITIPGIRYVHWYIRTLIHTYIGTYIHWYNTFHILSPMYSTWLQCLFTSFWYSPVLLLLSTSFLTLPFLSAMSLIRAVRRRGCKTYLQEWASLRLVVIPSNRMYII